MKTKEIIVVDVFIITWFVTNNVFIKAIQKTSE